MEAQNDGIDSKEDHIQAAKAYLLKASTNSGLTMYDHMITVLKRVLDEKPDKVIDLLEQYSRNEKRALFQPQKDTLQDKKALPSEVLLANEQKELFNRKNVEIPDTIADNEGDEEEQITLPDVMENAFYFEQAGIGVGREEMFRIFLALKQLTDTYKLRTCRFWGKILGTKKNYVIAEVQFVDGEDPYQDDEEQLDILAESAEARTATPKGDTAMVDEIETEDLPKSNYKPPPVIPKEPYGEGCNKRVYYACNDAGLSWHRLPPVSPQQIHVARQIRKMMTGNLEEEVISYPPFPGSEANYLRAQIARISCATHVSPQGYYIFEEDEDDDEEGARTTFVHNVEFEGIPVSDLCDSSLAFWVHHNQYILPQGRTTWFNPSEKAFNEDEMEEEEDEEEEREEPDDIEPEEGPALLTPLSEDQEVNAMPAWTPVKSTTLVSQYAIAVIHSNLWPGAHAFAVDKKFDNVYIGYGLKYSPDNYSPPAPPAAQDEFPSGPEITEAEDPTVEQERAIKAARQEAEEDGEEEEESDDYDEDD